MVDDGARAQKGDLFIPDIFTTRVNLGPELKSSHQ